MCPIPSLFTLEILLIKGKLLKLPSQVTILGAYPLKLQLVLQVMVAI
uniref:Uncharacterized protein n=1 Tax=Rhizophora mucronata TaxID=61149 RepID=A0A2P2PH67_RHIMU